MKKQTYLAVLFVATVFMVMSCEQGDENDDTPTCYDDIKNGAEIGIDCGGRCAPCTSKNSDSDDDNSNNSGHSTDNNADNNDTSHNTADDDTFTTVPCAGSLTANTLTSDYTVLNDDTFDIYDVDLSDHFDYREFIAASYSSTMLFKVEMLDRPVSTIGKRKYVTSEYYGEINSGPDHVRVYFHNYSTAARYSYLAVDDQNLYVTFTDTTVTFEFCDLELQNHDSGNLPPETIIMSGHFTYDIP